MWHITEDERLQDGRRKVESGRVESVKNRQLQSAKQQRGDINNLSKHVDVSKLRARYSPTPTVSAIAASTRFPIVKTVFVKKNMINEIALKCARKHARTTNIIGNVKRLQVRNKCSEEKTVISVGNRSQAPNGVEMYLRSEKRCRMNVVQISRFCEVSATVGDDTEEKKARVGRVKALKVETENNACRKGYETAEGRMAVSRVAAVGTELNSIEQNEVHLLGRKERGKEIVQTTFRMPTRFCVQIQLQVLLRSPLKQSTQLQHPTAARLPIPRAPLAQFEFVLRFSIKQSMKIQLGIPPRFPILKATQNPLQPLSRFLTQLNTQTEPQATTKQPTQIQLQVPMRLTVASCTQSAKFHTSSDLSDETHQRRYFQNVPAKQTQPISHLTQVALQIQPPLRSSDIYKPNERQICGPLQLLNPLKSLAEVGNTTEDRPQPASELCNQTEVHTQTDIEHRASTEARTQAIFEHRTPTEPRTQLTFEHRTQAFTDDQVEFAPEMEHLSFGKTSQELPPQETSPPSFMESQSNKKLHLGIHKCYQTSINKLNYSSRLERQLTSQRNPGSSEIPKVICYSSIQRTRAESQQQAFAQQCSNPTKGAPHSYHAKSINSSQFHTPFSDWRDLLCSTFHYRRRNHDSSGITSIYLHLSYLFSHSASLLIFSTLLLFLTALPCVRAACRDEPARPCEIICTGDDSLNCTLRALLLLPDDDSYVASMRRSLPVMHLAEQYIRENSLLPKQLRWEWMTGDVKCEAAYATIKAMDGIVKNCAHVVFGPVCDYALAAVSRIAKYFNHNGTPVISIGGATDSFEAEKTSCGDEFYMLLRSGLLSFKSISLMIIELLKRYKWTNSIVFYERDGQNDVIGEHSCYLMMKSFGNEMRDLNLTFAQYSIMPDLYNRTEELKREIGNKHASKCLKIKTNKTYLVLATVIIKM